MIDSDGGGDGVSLAVHIILILVKLYSIPLIPHIKIVDLAILEEQEDQPTNSTYRARVSGSMVVDGSLAPVRRN